ncbi:MAG: CoA-binding protein, partial [Kiloniellales bacterium]|nr:CoA-binding protein [Kiloniellales bacterium]
MDSPSSIERSALSAGRRANIARLLRPRSIVFVGGQQLARPIDSCRSIGFSGDMWAVNPARKELAGLICYPSLAELPAVPDAAFIAVNAGASIAVVEELNRLGAGGAVCYAAGYAERGEAGLRLQEQLVHAAGDVAILGPNCYGLLNYLDGVALWADAHGGEALEEGAAIISQSGNISLNFTMTERSVPLAKVIAVGNQAQLGPGDFIEPLLEDPRIKAIGLYLEGLDDVSTFSRAALAALEKGVPLVALKVGRSAHASRIAASHTASLAGEDGLYSALFDRLGVMRVPSLTAFMETLKFLSLHGGFAGGRLGVLTCSGGDAALFADLADREGLTIPPLSQKQVESISAQVTHITTVANPLDYNTAIWGAKEKLETCFTAVMSEGTDATALVIDYARGHLPGIEEWDAAIEGLIGAAARAKGLGLAVATFPELLPERVRRRLIAKGLIPLQGLEEAMIALGRAHWYEKRRTSLLARGDVSDLRLARLPSPQGAPRNCDEAESKSRLKSY